MDDLKPAAMIQQPVKKSFYYGWLMVFIAAMGVFFSGPGQTYSVSMFIESYIREFGWSRSFVSSLYSSGTLLAGLTLPLVGRMIDLHGSRVMVTSVASLFGLVCLYMSFVVNPAMLFFGFLLVRLLGQGSMTLTSSTLVPQWFVSKRGRALSLMALGGALSSAVLPPLNTWLIQTQGWRFGWQVWAVLLWAVMVPTAWFFIRNRPEDMGLKPDNDRREIPTPEQEGNGSLTLKMAMKTRSYWLLLFCVTIPSAITTGITFHLASIMVESGFTPETAMMLAASVLSTFAVVQLPCNLVAGYLADRFRVRYLMALSFGGQLMSLVLLMFIANLPMAIAYGAFWGVISALFAININVILPQYYGRRYLGSIRGTASTAMVIGSAFGPLPFGFAYDIFGGYQEIFLLSMLFPLLGVIAALLSTPPYKSEQCGVI